MDWEICDVEASDLEAVLTLNQTEVPHVGSVDLDKMKWFAANAAYFRTATVDKQLAAYLIGMRPGTAYESLNYRWFCDRYDDFAYVDRIAVASGAETPRRKASSACAGRRWSGPCRRRSRRRRPSR